MNHQNMIIGVLTVTATILLVGLILLGTLTQQPAHAVGQNDRCGNYLMATGQWNGNRELLWILDAKSGNLGMYYFDSQRARIELADMDNLQQP